MKNSPSVLKQFLLSFLPCRIYLGKRLEQKKRVAITFDDGPNPQHTDKILDILQKRNIRATFFFSGKQISEYSSVVRRAWEEGHRVANHSFSHSHISDIGFDDYASEIEKTNVLIREITGKPCSLFRPPFGELNFELFLYAATHGLTIVSWTLDSCDSFINTSKGLKEKLGSTEIKNGEIILFHDDYRHTVDSLDDILEDIGSRGFTFVTIDEFLS